MADEHTPTEAQVRSCYGAAAITGEGQDRRLAGFDRLMAEIRREAAAQALREAAEILRAEDMGHDRWYADALERRADRIARGEGS